MNPQDVRGVWCSTCKHDLYDEREVFIHARRHATPVCFTEADGPFLGEPRPRLPAITINEVLDLRTLPASAWAVPA